MKCLSKEKFALKFFIEPRATSWVEVGRGNSTWGNFSGNFLRTSSLDIGPRTIQMVPRTYSSLKHYQTVIGPFSNKHQSSPLSLSVVDLNWPARGLFWRLEHDDLESADTSRNKRTIPDWPTCRSSRWRRRPHDWGCQRRWWRWPSRRPWRLCCRGRSSTIRRPKISIELCLSVLKGVLYNPKSSPGWTRCSQGSICHYMLGIKILWSAR